MKNLQIIALLVGIFAGVGWGVVQWEEATRKYIALHIVNPTYPYVRLEMAR
jgi:hypothetical protein